LKLSHYLCLLCLIGALCSGMSYTLNWMNFYGSSGSTLGVVIVSPSNGSIVHGICNIVISSWFQNNSSDNATTWLMIDVSVVKYWFGVGNFSYFWNTTEYSDGIHKLVAFVNTTSGQDSSYSILVRVSNSDLNLSILSPMNNSIVFDIVDIHIVSEDPNGNMTWLEIDNKIVQAWPGTGEFIYSWNTTQYGDGSHEIIAAMNTTTGEVDYYRIILIVYSTYNASMLCNLTIRVARSDLTLIIDGAHYRRFPINGVFAYGQNLSIAAEYSGNYFAFDDHSFALEFNSSFVYTIPNAPNSTLTIFSLNYTVWSHPGETEYEYSFGVSYNKSDYYVEASKIQLYNNMLFVRCGFSQTEAIEIYDITQNPFKPLYVYTSPHGGVDAFLGEPIIIENPTDFYVFEDYMIYVRQGEMLGYVFEIYNISDISNPQMIGYLNLTDWDHSGVWVSVSGNYAIVSAGGGIYTVNISDPHNPTIAQDVVSLNASFGADVGKHILYNGVLFVICESGVVVLNATDLSNITKLSEIPLNRTVFDIYASDSFLFVTTRFDGVYIYNISDVNNIRMLLHIDLTDSRSCEYHDGLLFVADGVGGIKVLNISDIDNPYLIYANKTEDVAVDIEWSNKTLFVSCRLAGISQYDLSNLSAIHLVNGIRYLEYTSKLEYGPALVMKIYGSNDSTGIPGMSLEITAGDYRGYTISTQLNMFPLPVFIYNDTNGDRIFTQIPTQSATDIYRYEGYSLSGKRFLMTNDSQEALYKFIPPRIARIGDTYCVHIGLEIDNISLVTSNIHWGTGGGLPIYGMDISDASGKANITYHFFIYYCSMSDIRMKIAMDISLYDIVGIDTNFSVFSGFLMETAYTSMGCSRPSPINLTISQLGKDMYTMMGTKVFLFDMNGNYSILREENETFCGAANISIMYPWSFYNYSLEALVIGANFHNISSGATIRFDPKIDIFKQTVLNIIKKTPTLDIYCDSNNTWTDIFTFRWESYAIGTIDMFINGVYNGSLPLRGVKTMDSEGIWKIILVGIGAKSSIIKVLIAKIDNTAPKIEIATPKNGTEIYTATLTISWEANDELSGIDHYEIYVDDELIANNISADTTNFTLTNLKTGKCIIKIKAVDKAGNSAYVTIEVYIRAGGVFDEYSPIIAVVVAGIAGIIFVIVMRKKRKAG